MPPPAQLGQVEIDVDHRRLVRDGRLVRLSRTEWGLLELLARNRGQVLTHRMLLRDVWGDAYGEEINYLHVYMRRLRRKLEPDPARPRYILSEPGVGYRLVAPAASTLREPAAAAPALAERPNDHRLPAPLTSFVGRRAELASIAALLRQPQVRLVTLTGPGGVGKTRLALEAARAYGQPGASTTHLVRLDSIPTPDLLLPAIGHVLDSAPPAGTALISHLAAALGDRPLLLVLDNVEHLLAAAPDIAALLAAAQGLKILATSHEALRLSGEHEIVVPPLALSAARADDPAGELRQAEAVQLFVDRARAAKPDVQFTPEASDAIAAICARLDGLPLAIELAAMRIKRFVPQALLLHLDRRLPLLTAGARDKPERHQTMRNAIDWGYQLLQPPEQVAFARLAVFGGRSPLDAITAVCQLPGEAAGDLAERLWSLVEKSFAHQTSADDGVPWFGMLEVLREYATELLAARGELITLQQRHAAHYLDLAEQAEAQLRGPQQEAWLQRLEREHANLRAALNTLVAATDSERGLRMVGALWRFWIARGYVSEGVHWCTATLALPMTAAPTTQARALNALGGLHWTQGDYPAARQFFGASLALWRELENHHEISRILNNLGSVAWRTGDYAASWTYFQESLALRRQLGDRLGLSSTLNNLGNLAWIRRQYDEAQALYLESLGLCREVGDCRGAAHCLNNLGTVALLQRAYGQSEAFYRESLALFREVGDKQGIAQLLNNVGNCLMRQAQPEQAQLSYQEALDMSQALGDKQGAAYALTGLAAVAALGGSEVSAAYAVTLLAAAHQQMAAIGAAWDVDELALHEETVAATTARLAAAAFAEAWERGLATSPEQAVALAQATRQHRSH
jgi:predicted ATPase/DNA-binding winged helix-turn-helix (wHTH) protein/Tfp pilus assembly protein PilF